MWRKIILLDELSSSDIQEENDSSIFEQAKQIKGFKNLYEENLEDWQSDECEPGCNYLTDVDIINNCVVKYNSDDSTDAEDVLNEGNTMSHSAELQSVETFLNYMEQRGSHYCSS